MGSLTYICIILLVISGSCFGHESNECHSSPCQNGAACLQAHMRYTCLCNEGYKGTHCETVVVCNSNPCLNRGYCQETTEGYMCICRKGYKGLNCEKVSECQANSCQNNGICMEKTNGYYCYCRKGFKGDQCEKVADCQTNPCQKGGICQETSDGFTCSCRTGYKGVTCETVAVCLSNPCQHDGFCEETSDGYLCFCHGNYTGDQCEKEISTSDSVSMEVITELKKQVDDLIRSRIDLEQELNAMKQKIESMELYNATRMCPQEQTDPSKVIGPKPFFSVKSSTNITGGFNIWKTLVFDEAISNVPSRSYNIDTGIYTAPISGYYLLIVDCSSQPYSDIKIRLRITNVNVVQEFDSIQGHTGLNIIHYMDEGNQASVEWFGGRHYIIWDINCIFSGLLYTYA